MTDYPSFPGLFSGILLKQIGIDQVSGNNHEWLVNGLDVINRHAPWEREFLAEEFRLLPGIGRPTHSNAWGALTRTAIGHGLIQGTGRFERAISPLSHAHVYPVYRRIMDAYW